MKQRLYKSSENKWLKDITTVPCFLKHSKYPFNRTDHNYNCRACKIEL